MQETFYHIGPRASVAAAGEARTFTYQRLELNAETHTAGPWAGWAVQWLADAQGRLATLQVQQAGQTVRAFGLSYDGFSRLSRSSSPELHPRVRPPCVRPGQQ